MSSRIPLTADALRQLKEEDSDSDAQDCDGAEGEANVQDGGDEAASSQSSCYGTIDSDEERLARIATPTQRQENRFIEVMRRKSGSGHVHPQESPLRKQHQRQPSTSDEERASKVWYFSYGSNLNVAQLLTRIGMFADKRSCSLKNYALKFNKKVTLKPNYGLFNEHLAKAAFANVVPFEGATVYGVAYLITPTQMQLMDAFEGVNSGHYTRSTMECCVLSTGVKLPCEVYVACPNAVADGILPTDAYISHLLGGRGLLPDEYMNYIAQHPRLPR